MYGKACFYVVAMGPGPISDSSLGRGTQARGGDETGKDPAQRVFVGTQAEGSAGANMHMAGSFELSSPPPTAPGPLRARL